DIQINDTVLCNHCQSYRLIWVNTYVITSKDRASTRSICGAIALTEDYGKFTGTRSHREAIKYASLLHRTKNEASRISIDAHCDLIGKILISCCCCHASNILTGSCDSDLIYSSLRVKYARSILSPLFIPLETSKFGRSICDLVKLLLCN